MNLEIRKGLSRTAGRLAYMNGQPVNAVEQTNPALIIKAAWREGYAQELVQTTVAQDASEQDLIDQGTAEGKEAFLACGVEARLPYHPEDTGDRHDALKAKGWKVGLNQGRQEQFTRQVRERQAALIKTIEVQAAQTKPQG